MPPRKLDSNRRPTDPLPPLPMLSGEAKAAGKRALLASLAPGRDIWVFGYGSLMWDPGFAHLEAHSAVLHGFHRDFCIYSHRYRGTPERPGLVLGLNHGGSCRGMAYRVHGGRARDTLDYLWEREMVTGVYEPRRVTVRADVGVVPSWTFVADRHHVQYAGGLDTAEKVALIAQGQGRSGPCRDYLANTVRHLDELGIGDGPLHRLLTLVEREPAKMP
jgi:cation transport protein ChaC